MPSSDTTPTPRYFAVWSWSPQYQHKVLICVYTDPDRARESAARMGGVMRPVTGDEVRTYFEWRMTKTDPEFDHDPYVSLYLYDTAPLLRLSALAAYIDSH
jgi:hypothetical protein